MKTLLMEPSVSPAVGFASPVVPAGTHWLWWLFLAGVLACSFAGPPCALS
jgi:hypothetical protein